jgi:O-antigen biosynthesis protein
MSSTERFNPMDHPLSMVWPKRLTGHSAWVGHTPFAMALVDMCRPDRIVELGTLNGDSYCAFCQAVEILKLPTRCTAIDTWQGDPHAGMYGPEVLKDLRDHHDIQYSSFSNLWQMTFDEAVKQVPDGSIDLLHIDGFHTYDAVKHDYETWLPKLSRRGVVMFHDTHVRETDFGVWQLWEALAGKLPSFEFHHGCGLGVLAVGDQAPPALLKFLEIARGDSDAVRKYFTHTGDVVDTSRIAIAMITNLQKLQTMLNIRKRMIGEAFVEPPPETAFLSPVKYVENTMRDAQVVLVSEMKQRGFDVRLNDPQKAPR